MSAWSLASGAWAQGSATDAGALPAVTITSVSTPGGERPLFGVAGSVDRVEGAELRAQRLQAQLSEGLGGVPGLQVQDRRNLAQDLQLSIRGFGARSTFGVRGLRLYVDGIPATMPDGQGQTSSIEIGALERIEVLRGPFSALYGNSSGGVLQAFTAPGAGRPLLRYSAGGGSFGTWRQALELSGAQALGSPAQVDGPALDYRLSLSRFATEGWRDHSAARRDLANARLGLALENGARLTLVYNGVRIAAQDPLGLTEQQWRLSPRAAPLARQYDTRKTVDQQQLGLLYEQRLAPNHELRLMLYGGERRTTQFQSIPPAAQRNPRHAGGVIGLARRYSGIDLRWTTQQTLAGRPLEVASGLAWDGLREARRGYENHIGPAAAPVLGVQGRLRRDERNTVRSLDPYVQARWQFADAWRLEAGARRSRVRFESQDRYGSNGDDSGQARHARLLPVAALRWQPRQDLALYLSAGRGFETPTLNELSYRPDATDGAGGLNLGLRPAVSTSVELGAKVRLAGGLLTAAVFRTRTRDEIVAHSSVNGRATFQNAGRTRRHGAEIGWLHESTTHWRTQLAWTWLDARYAEGFCTPLPCSAANRVLPGARLPGVARQSLYAAFGWAPPQGWRAGVDLRAQSRVMANDRNSVAAPGYAVAGAWLGWLHTRGAWTLEAFARIDNLAGRRYAGSVIVNEGNGRYFEPAPGRQWSAGLSAAYRF